MTATPIIPPIVKFYNSLGSALSLGKVYTYESGTNIPKDTYTDYTANIVNPNPVILDESGSASIWLDGDYRITLTDFLDNIQDGYPQDGVISFTQISDYYVTTGSPNAYILTPSPPLLEYIEGTQYYIKASFTNTGASTINVSGLGPKDIVTGFNTPLTTNKIIEGVIYIIVYNGTAFQILNKTPTLPNPITIHMSFESTAPTNHLPMVGETVSKTSGAVYNGSQYRALYKYLWESLSNAVAPVAGGRGVDALDDFDANKSITIPDYSNYSPFGVSAAGAITEAGVKAGSQTQASAGTPGDVGSLSLSIDQIPSHNHGIFEFNGGTPGELRVQGGSTILASTNSDIQGTGGGGGHTHTPSVFTGTPTNIVHNAFGVYYYINYV